MTKTNYNKHSHKSSSCNTSSYFEYRSSSSSNEVIDEKIQQNKILNSNYDKKV